MDYDIVQSSNPTAPHIWGLIYKRLFFVLVISVGLSAMNEIWREISLSTFKVWDYRSGMAVTPEKALFKKSINPSEKSRLPLRFMKWCFLFSFLVVFSINSLQFDAVMNNMFLRIFWSVWRKIFTFCYVMVPICYPNKLLIVSQLINLCIWTSNGKIFQTKLLCVS